MHIIGIIPARLASTRFPNKPLVPIIGMPMIGHIYYRTKMCKNLNDVWVATCDREIFDYIESLGGRAVMTADSHQRASDRIAEATVKIEQAGDAKIDYVAMIQGDEPMLVPDMIDDLVNPILENPGLQVTNLISRVSDQEEFENPNVVKVVLDSDGFALYFSREPIPSRKKFKGDMNIWKQLGMILFSKKALLDYANMTPTPLEIIESVDMLRYLEHGTKIKMVETKFKSHGVDVPDDLHPVEKALLSDPLTRKYMKL